MNNQRVPIRILIVDDQDLFRAGLRMVLESDPLLKVIGQAGDGIEAISQARALHPDVILMDIRMPKLDGLEATQRIATDHIGREESSPRIMVLTTLETVEASRDALASGASGFMLKNAEPEFLIAAIKAMAGGQQIIASSTLPHLSPTPQTPAEYLTLTDREKEVFAALAHGMNNREIADSLFLSEATIKTHLTAVLQKLSLRDRVQAVVYAYTHRLVS